MSDKVKGNRDPLRHITKIEGPWYKDPPCKCGVMTGIGDFHDADRVCTVSHDSVPCRVLDPFCGACTTLKIAEKLGIDSWGIDLAPLTEGLINAIR